MVTESFVALCRLYGIVRSTVVAFACTRNVPQEMLGLPFRVSQSS